MRTELTPLQAFGADVLERFDVDPQRDRFLIKCRGCRLRWQYPRELKVSAGGVLQLLEHAVRCATREGRRRHHG